MAGKVKVTIGIFMAIKSLLKDGATRKECCEYFGLNDATIGHIKNSETYEEYKHKVYTTSPTYRKKMAAIKAKEEKAKEVAKQVNAVPASELVKEEKKEVKEERQTIVVQASHYMLEEQKKTNELLTLISNKLAMIITDLYGGKE